MCTHTTQDHCSEAKRVSSGGKVSRATVSRKIQTVNHKVNHRPGNESVTKVQLKCSLALAFHNFRCLLNQAILRGSSTKTT